jgi:hypothetical protein
MLPLLSAGKVMLTLCWDFNGSILEQYHDRGQTVNSVRYCIVLEGEIKSALYENAEECCQMELFCTMTKLDIIRQQRPLKRFKN